jgi:type VI secretion system protein ImpA
MGSPALLNIVALLQPIPGPNPAGLSLSNVDERTIEELAEPFELDDPTVPRAKLTKYDKLIDLLQNLLKKNGKDRRTAFELVRALAKRHHFAGLRDGLRLLEQLCAQCWDIMLPSIDPNDPEDIAGRSGPFGDVLNDEQARHPFPYLVRSLPLFQVGQTIVTKMSLDSEGTVAGQPAAPKVPYESFKQLTASLTDDTRAKLQTTVDDIKDAIAAAKQLEDTLAAQVAATVAQGRYDEKLAPKVRQSATVGFGNLRHALEDCLKLAEEGLNAQAGAADSPAADDPTATATTTTAPSTSTTGPRPLTREGIYLQLKELADKLEKLEPHSPVPILLRRVIELRVLPFPDLVDNLGAKPLLDFIRTPIKDPATN